MFRRSKFRLQVAWALLFAVLFNIAAPSLATARKPVGLGEICTTSGLKTMVASGVDRAPGDHADLLHDGHCQLCTIDLPAGLFFFIASALPVTAGPSTVPVPEPSMPLAAHTNCPPPPSHAPPFFS